jgi:tetratricopeptide (TPR) repeat protein
MIDSAANPWDLLYQHRYHEAYGIFDKLARNSRCESGLDFANRATIRLFLNRLPEALADFTQANQFAREEKATGGKSSPYLENIAAVQWLLGERDAAIETARSSVRGLLSGEIQYADNAGGVSNGLLLWYMAITKSDIAVRDYAEKFLQKLAKKSRIQYWPGPLALLALGEKTAEEILRERWSTSNLDELTGQSPTKKNLLKRRQLVQALFYWATSLRKTNHEEQCLALFLRCVSIPNPLGIEEEWYLAQREVAGLQPASS